MSDERGQKGPYSPRASNGRFTAGAKPGPGRPRQDKERGSSVSDAHFLFLGAAHLQEASNAWHFILTHFPLGVIKDLVAEVVSKRESVPMFVWDFLRGRV